MDARLLRLAPQTRYFLLGLTGLSVVAGVLIVAQAELLATLLAGAVSGQVPALVVPLALVAVGRAALSWAQAMLAKLVAGRVKAELRTALLADTQRLGPAWLSHQRAGELGTLVTTGVEALEAYLTGYLPALVSSVTVPVVVLVRLVFADWISAGLIALTLPLIPLFAALVGQHTRERTRRQWRLLSRLGGHFLDTVSGLGTLRLFGRAGAQAAVVRRMARAHASATMGTLRVAFLSALVLELVATLSVALVAVPVGLRLLAGGVGLDTALLVLLLAPEAYLPLRAAGAKFHASAEGLAALEQAFAVRDAVGESHFEVRARVPDLRVAELRLERVTVRYPDRKQAALREVDLTIRPGERIALVGQSGGGKSTVLALLLGFVTPEHGRVLVGEVDLRAIDQEQWRRQLAWLPQRPHLFAASLADNIALGLPDADVDAVRAAATMAALDEVLADLPDGLDTRLGDQGSGVSAGQRQRIALARAFLRHQRQGTRLLLLDEPTARLDGRSEAAVLRGTSMLAQDCTAVLVAHRPALLDVTDRVVQVQDGRVSTPAVVAGRLT